MEVHCWWINNCVGAYNHKFYVLTLLYTLLLSAIVVLCACDSIDHILFVRNWARRCWFNKDFWLLFWTMASMMGGGAYFACRAWVLLDEQVESICENQTFIDELKDLYGTPRPTRFGAL